MVRKFAFAFVCAYSVFQWIPLAVQLGAGSFTAGNARWPTWGRITAPVGDWVIAHVLRLPPSPLRLSANNLSLVMGMVTLTLLAAVIAAAWVWVTRDRPPRARSWLRVHTVLRFMLIAPLLSYGWGKVTPSQFGLSLDYVAIEVAQHNPRDLLWAFMTGSREYQVVTGLVELAAGVLLISRRTAPLGALLAVFAMGHVVILDFCYDLPIKFLALQLLLLSLVVWSPFAGRFFAAIVMNRPVGAQQAAPLFAGVRADRIARVAGGVLGAWLIAGSLIENNMFITQANQRRQSPLVGVWDVDRVTRAGAEVPLLSTDASLWRRLIIQSTNAAVVVPMVPSTNRIRNVVRSGLQVSMEKKELRLAPFPMSDAIAPLAFSFELVGGDRLILRSSDPPGPVTMQLRRFDVSNYTLLSWTRTWDW